MTMPLYEYECLKCGVHFEKLQRFGDPQPRACPNGHTEVHRLFSQPAIIFKGSGFYATDHPNGRGAASGKGRGKQEPTPAGEKKEAKSAEGAGGEATS
jgi:putative FmdB family regulatory protein